MACYPLSWIGGVSYLLIALVSTVCAWSLPFYSGICCCVCSGICWQVTHHLPRLVIRFCFGRKDIYVRCIHEVVLQVYIYLWWKQTLEYINRLAFASFFFFCRHVEIFSWFWHSKSVILYMIRYSLLVAFVVHMRLFCWWVCWTKRKWLYGTRPAYAELGVVWCWIKNKVEEYFGVLLLIISIHEKISVPFFLRIVLLASTSN